MKSEAQQIAHTQMLADCRDILKRSGITAILTNSALLGGFRDGDLIPHCYGAVLTTFRKEIKPRGKKVIEDLRQKGFKIVKHFINNNYKIRVAKGVLNIEIVAYSEDEACYYRQLKKKRKVIPKKLLRTPYSRITIRGEVFDAPHNIKKFLRFLYKDWTVKLGAGSAPSFYKTDRHMVIK